MRRSMFEMYIDLLKVLAQRGPLKLTHIMYKANVNQSVLKEHLGFLIQHGLVEEKALGKDRVVYVVTEKGLKALKHVRELEILIPVKLDNGARIPSSLY
ncbi:MAG: hypothetical protein CW691_00350 [Candidatus Bathyarchaeum sp.]|nr:MAG: hypothetical protein CW691_00350 [Candidatus Bathyarchaeum sp.]